jgi:hypothetical protein
MSLDERSYPTPPLKTVRRFARNIVQAIEGYWKERVIRRIRSVSPPSSNLRSRPA